jgi:D-alanyl-lipoteichoic acid acyltransferase DltB (MBOAT superfamily)
MDFVSVIFIGFVIALGIVYFTVPKSFQWFILLVASYTFYIISSSELVVYLIITTCVTFLTGNWIGKIIKDSAAFMKAHKGDLSREEKKKFKSKTVLKKKAVLVLAVLINLGLLIYLKYFNFIGSSINSLAGTQIPRLNLLLPLGISFYTLQSIGYLVDLYRGKFEPDRNIFKFALFMSFFPQIIQGPFARYDHLAKQLYEKHRFNYERITMGVQLILWGFMKKLILADRIAVPVNQIFNNYASYGGFMIFFASAGYGLQVYADFSSGMDIARGVAQIYGIELSLNFERPYFAKSVSEFWRRWHITLGAWMRDYIFYPLSLSSAFASLGKGFRKVFGNYVGKKIPSFLSMFIVFLLVGIWHGSSWIYVGYGLWNGIIITSSIMLEPVYVGIAKKLRINTDCFSWRFFQMVRTFVLCSMGRIFPRASSMTAVWAMFKSMFTDFNPWVFWDSSFLQLGLTYKDYMVVFICIIVLFVVGNMQEKGMVIRKEIAKQNLYFRWLLYIGAVLVLLIYGMYGPGYSASEFIYQQF